MTAEIYTKDRSYIKIMKEDDSTDLYDFLKKIYLANNSIKDYNVTVKLAEDCQRHYLSSMLNNIFS